MRTLSWKPHLGSVTLDVELEDRTLTNLTVSPIHAAIILHFQEKSTTSRFKLIHVFSRIITAVKCCVLTVLVCRLNNTAVINLHHLIGDFYAFVFVHVK